MRYLKTNDADFQRDKGVTLLSSSNLAAYQPVLTSATESQSKSENLKNSLNLQYFVTQCESMLNNLIPPQDQVD